MNTNQQATTLSKKYWCSKYVEVSTNTSFYIRLLPWKDAQPQIIFKQNKNSLLVTIRVWFQGNYYIPPNMLLMNLETSIGSISNLTLYEIKEITNNARQYETSFNININSNNILNKESFLEELFISASFDINKEVYNNSNLPGYFIHFYNDFIKINFNSSVYFNNYFPISKLSEYYINSNYKSDYKNLNELPKDFYDWANKEMTIYPEFWFNKATVFEDIDYQPINHLYKANSDKTLLTKTFDKVSVTVIYYIDNVEKKLDLDFSNVVDSNLDSNNNLYLGVKTLYNFENKELYQSNSGVSGIYFPVPTNGNLIVNLEKNGITYKDKIPFNFRNEFYSSKNNNIVIEVNEFTQVSGQWTEVAYA